MAQDVVDDLTGLPSRRAFLSSLRRAVLHANENRSTLALLVIDIDGFSHINGAHGYEAGDQALRFLAQQLRRVGRSGDQLARIGDNRFVLQLSKVMNAGHAELAARKLLRLLDLPLDLGGQPLRVSVSVGIALCPMHSSHYEQLLRQAETALIRARQLRHPIEFAPDQASDLGLSELWDLELQLEGAIDRGELVIHYQPQLRVSDLQPVGAEALMRWNSRSRGIVSPDVFIPLAERTGQIKKLTVWALNTVLRQASQWKHPWRDLSVSVNLPGELASQRDLPDLVENALRLWGSEKVQLMLEITERSLMTAHLGHDTLDRVRDLGVNVSIDDFGTGYSCLAYFKNIPADELKIDRSFVAGLLNDTASADITTLIIELAHRFGLKVAAEGVEDAATLSELRRRGCDIAQGYLLGRPMPQAEFQQWLDAQSRRRPPPPSTSQLSLSERN